MAAIALTSTTTNVPGASGGSSSSTAPDTTIAPTSGTDPTTPRRKLSISTTNLPTNLSGARTFDLPRETDTPRNPTTARRASHSQGQRPEMLANVAPPAQLNGALPRNGEREGGSDCTAWCVVA